MKKWVIIVGVALVMAVPSLAISKKICPCGMDVAKSETKFYVTIEGKKTPTCSVRCVFELAFVKHKTDFQDRENPVLQSIEAMDFESGEMFKAMDGYFVLHSDVIPKGSMKPYVLGFSTLERANAFWKKNKKPGVRVANFETATHDVIGILRIEGKLPQREAPMEQIEFILQREK
ncbi:MAG: hypothetical protein DDT19_00413 [Syntrophomonadaceae bacterium]|nr:hypothetical protein [Bacillota bacterium]